jgi:hypothetical protein
VLPDNLVDGRALADERDVLVADPAWHVSALRSLVLPVRPSLAAAA